jgi:hypothetical protein
VTFDIAADLDSPRIVWTRIVILLPLAHVAKTDRATAQLLQTVTAKAARK